MSRFDLLRSFAWCIVAMASACGGGGGGGGGGGSEGDSAYGVRVLHAAIDGVPVDLSSSSSSAPLLSQQVFAGTKGYRGLPDGIQTLSLTRTQTPSDVKGTFSVGATSNDRYTILLYGDTTTFGLRTRLIKDEIPELNGNAAIRVINGVTKAAEVTVTVGSSSAQSVAFGGDSGYILTAPGAVTITAARSVDGSPLQSGPITLAGDTAYTLLLAGEVGYYVKSVLFTDGR
jgi:hypothetical protein